MSFIILTIAEMFGASSGMGYFIQYYSDFSQYHYVLAGIIFNSIIIVMIMAGFELLKKRLSVLDQYKVRLKVRSFIKQKESARPINEKGEKNDTSNQTSNTCPSCRTNN